MFTIDFLISYQSEQPADYKNKNLEPFLLFQHVNGIGQFAKKLLGWPQLE